MLQRSETKRLVAACVWLCLSFSLSVCFQWNTFKWLEPFFSPSFKENKNKTHKTLLYATAFTWWMWWTNILSRLSSIYSNNWFNWIWWAFEFKTSRTACCAVHLFFCCSCCCLPFFWGMCQENVYCHWNRWEHNPNQKDICSMIHNRRTIVFVLWIDFSSTSNPIHFLHQIICISSIQNIIQTYD